MLKQILDSKIFYSYKRDKVAIGASVVVGVFLVLATLANFIAPFDPYDLAAIDVMDSDLPPVWMENSDPRFLLGTDGEGRDLWSAILYGTRVSLLIGLFAVLLQASLGVLIGLIAGYFGGKVDAFLMRIADVQLSFSTLMVAIVFLAVFKAAFGPDLYNQWALLMLILVIGIAEWPQYARTIRACVLAEKRKEYVEACKVLGYGPAKILLKHIMPNVLSPIFVISTVQIANAIISEAALSFLGLGMPATQPSLGSLIEAGFQFFFSGSWWITIIPALVLIVLVLVLNLLGDWIRDTLNPKLYKS